MDRIWATLAAASAGIIVTSTCYVLTPLALALPVPPDRIADAAAVATQGHILAFGGSIGLFADMLFAGAALLLAMRGERSLGWAIAAVSAIVFTFADGMAARALSPGPAFGLAKAMFDMLFIAGTFSFGVATLLVFWPERKRWFAKVVLASGVLGLVASITTLAGADTGPLLGIAIGSGVTLYAIEGARRAFGGAMVSARGDAALQLGALPRA